MRTICLLMFVCLIASFHSIKPAATDVGKKGSSARRSISLAIARTLTLVDEPRQRRVKTHPIAKTEYKPAVEHKPAVASSSEITRGLLALNAVDQQIDVLSARRGRSLEVTYTLNKLQQELIAALLSSKAQEIATACSRLEEWL